MKTKYRKMALASFITILIWVCTDLALDDRLPVTNAVINIANSADRSLWASFDEEASFTIEEFVLKGPASTIAKARRSLDNGSLAFKFVLYPEQQGMSSPVKSPLNILDFLKQSKQIKELGLTVESCRPETVLVNVVKLTKTSVEVRCFDENQNPLTQATIEPPQVEVSVPQDWAEIAEVKLNRSEIRQARSQAIKKTPYFKLAGKIIEIQTPVKITMPPEGEKLEEYSITPAKIGFVFSQNLAGKYDAKLQNETEMAMISIKATPAAKNAYEQQPFQMLLYIRDGDEKAPESKRQLVYNFPAEYVREGEIELNQLPVEARFKLTTPPQAEPTASN